MPFLSSIRNHTRLKYQISDLDRPAYEYFPTQNMYKRPDLYVALINEQ